MSISAPETPADEKSSRRFSARTVIIAGDRRWCIVIDVIRGCWCSRRSRRANRAQPCPFPVCFINGTLEFPAPHVIWPADFVAPTGGLAIIFTPSITSTMFTLWIVSVGLLIAIFVVSRGGAGVPGELQNFGEWAYESMESFASSIGGLAARALHLRSSSASSC